MRGEVTLLRGHCRSPRRDLGIRLLPAGVAVRALPPPGLRRWQSGETSASRQFWPHRHEWPGGYEPVHDVMNRAHARTYAGA